MTCIICFLDDQFQERLRNFSHSSSEKFETTIKNYQNSFFNELKFICEIDECTNHKNLQPGTKSHVKKYFDNIHKNLGVFAASFNKLSDVYNEWIMGKNKEAENILFKYLKENCLLDFTHEVNNSILFRGRWSKNPLNSEDMFHIPFNKRYLIGNQRYSISGQPVLYFGLSPIDVIHELRLDLDNIKNVYFSSFLHTSGNLNVFDLTNKFPNKFKNIEILINDGMSGTFDIVEKEIVKFMHLFILSQLCSFQRSKVSEISYFSEEYVIPQLLTSVLRENEFDGILFSSTRTKYNTCYSKAHFHVNMHRENLALFTKYSDKNNVDTSLREQFSCSKPLEINDLIEINLSDLSQLRKQIGKIINGPDFVKPFDLNISKLFGAETIVNFKDFVLFIGSKEILYFDHEVGKLHLQLLYQILMDFRKKTTAFESVKSEDITHQNY